MADFDPDADYCYITTVGRVTGNLHTIEIWFAAVNETLFVLAGSAERADFVRNARKTSEVTVRVGKRTSAKRNATARVVTGVEEDAMVRRLLLDKYQSSNDLEEWGRTALPVAFHLTSCAAVNFSTDD